MDDQTGLAGRNALVTGSSQRLGRAFAFALARQGVNVIIHYRGSEEAAAETASDLRGLGIAAEPIAADLADPAQTHQLFTSSLAALGGIDILINNASVFEPLDWQTTDINAWQTHLAVNLTAPLLLAQDLAKHLTGRRGDIINLLDWRALRPGPDHLPYTISKAGLAALTRSLAQALAPSIRVNGIAPGAILPPPGVEGKNPDLIQGVPAERWGTVEEVADAMLFLLGGSNYITGEILHLDGGRHLT